MRTVMIISDETIFKNGDVSGQLHRFMRSDPDVFDRIKLEGFLAECTPDFCLMSATMNGRIDMLKVLSEEHGADLFQSMTLCSEKYPGEKTQHNLLSAALGHQAYSPYVNRTVRAISRFNETIEYLLQQSLSAKLNRSPFESAVADAFLLAQPDSELVRHITSVPPRFGNKNHEPLALILKYQPEAIAALDAAFARESGRLISNFQQAVRALREVPVIKMLSRGSSNAPRIASE